MKLKLALLLAALAPAAFAQTYTTTSSAKCPTDTASVGVYAGTITSATTLRAVTLCPNQNFFVYVSGTTTGGSATVVYRGTDGTPLVTNSAATVATTSSLIASGTAGTFGHRQIVVSPTAALTAANAISVRVVVTPPPVR